MKTLPFSNLLLLLTTLILTGCGGGGGTTAPDPVEPPPTDNTPDPVVLTVTAVDGYLENARIYIDLNENYSFDETEPNGMSDANGQVTFTLTDIAEGLLKPIIVEAVEGQTIDKSTGLRVSQSFTMVAPAGSEVVSPLTTLAQLSLTQGQQADIASAIEAIKTQLGLPADADIMADYLNAESGSGSLYAIARSIVPLLPQDPATLFTGEVDSATVETLMSTATNVATAVLDAIAAGAEPGSIFVILSENGTATAAELTMEDAMAFIEDVQVWSEAFSFDFIQAASEFTYKVQAGAAIAESDTEALLNMLARYSEGGLLAVKTGLYREFDASLFVSGSSGTVTTAKNGETGVETVSIDAQLDDKTVVATITLSQQQSSTAALVSTLDSNTVVIEISEGSELVIDSDSYIPQKLSLQATIDTKSQNDQVHFAGALLIDTVTLVKSDGESTVISLSKIAISGLFDVAGQESFSGSLEMTLNSTLVDDALHIEVITIVLKLDADFAGVPDAYLVLDVSLGSQADEFSLVLAYGERKITLTFASTDDASELVVTNAMGMTLTLDLTLQQNAEHRGVLVMGIEQIASVSKEGGHYVVTFNDGTSVTLF